MKIFFKNSTRIKGKVLPEQILPSHLCTSAFPNGAATVVLSETKQPKPNFKIYFRGSEGQFHGLSRFVIASQEFKVNRYNTYFGQNSWVPTNEMPEIFATIKQVEELILS